MKRLNCVLYVLMAALLSAGAISSCGDKAAASETETEPRKSANETLTSSAETEEEPKVRIKADLPEMDFEGQTFNFYARMENDFEWNARDITADSTNGEPINDALFDRKIFIEDTYNAHLGVIPSVTQSIALQARTLVAAGDTSFQIFASNAYDAGTLALSNCLLDLNDVEYLDLSGQWWAQSTNESLSICGCQFYAAGDIFIVDNEGIRAVFFNKEMCEAYDLESPYSLVRNNKWTFDKYVEYCNTVYKDLNGDNTIDPEYDQFGSVSQNNIGEVFYLGAGEHMSMKDENGIPYLTTDTERALSVMLDISEILNRGSVSMDITGLHEYCFKEGRSLFWATALRHLEYTLRDCTVDIGVVPTPKYEEAQEGYYCYADGYCVNVVSIPTTNNEPEKAGFILEAMAADSLNNLTPAYFDVCLPHKYARDEESIEMLDLILKSSVMDNANIFSWGKLEGKLASAIIAGGSIASSIEKNRASAEKAIGKTVDTILSLKND